MSDTRSCAFHAHYCPGIIVSKWVKAVLTPCCVLTSTQCHRRNENGKDVVYPVNALAFHPTYGTFATGGGDGVINIWDGSNKKRLFQISQYPAAVASLSFSPDGSLLAVASSYMYEFGQQPHPADAIYIRRMQDVEVRPKPRAK